MNENGTIGESPRSTCYQLHTTERVHQLDVEVPGPDPLLEVDALRGQPRRCSGLQPAPSQTERFQRFAEPAVRRFSQPPGCMLLWSNVDQPVQKRPGRNHERRAGEFAAVSQAHASNAGFADKDRFRRADDPRDARLRIQRRTHRLAIRLLVGLRARRPDGRPAAAVQDLELDAGRVNRQAHQAAECVDLSDEMALGRPADRRIAGHVRDGFPGERAESHAQPQPRRRPCRFAPGVSRPDHDDVEGGARHSAGHLPMQNAEKMASSRSSVVRLPVTSWR
jgi:hypothetical protein